MRVGIVGTDLSGVTPGAGGLEHLLVGWAEGLAARFDVIVFSHVDVADVADAEVHHPTAFEVVPFRDPDHLVTLVNSLDVDVVHLNNRPSWARRMPCPTLFTAHNAWDAWSTSPDWSRSAARDSLGDVGACTAVSAFLAASIEREFGTPCEVVRPFVDPEFVEVGDEPVEKDRIVLFAGRLLQKKGVEYLVEISADARLERERFVFTDFIRPWREPTTEHEALRRMIESRSNCALVDPPTSRRGLARLIASSSVSVVPSVWDEPFGLVAIESIAAGTRVVASAVGGLPEAVGSAGTIVDLVERDTFIDAIIDSLEHPEVDRSARAEMVDRFSMEASVDGVVRLLLGAAV